MSVRIFFQEYGNRLGSTLDFKNKEDAQAWLDEFNKREDVIEGKSFLLFGAGVKES